KFTSRSSGGKLSAMRKERETMMTQTLDAVFQDGGFKPLDNGSLPFSEGQRVKLTVEFPSETKDNLVELAGHVYEGLSEKDIGEIERLDRKSTRLNSSHVS